MRRSLGPGAAAVAALMLCAAANADVVLMDGNFVPANWALELFGSGTQSAPQMVSGGNPDSFRQVTVTTGPTAGDATWGLHRFGTNTATRYDPATQGPIVSFDFWLDFRGVSGPHEGQMLFPALKQGNFTYIADDYAVGTMVSEAWQTLYIDRLTTVDFVRLDDGSAHPNFTSIGAPIRFGFVTAGITTESGPFTTVANYDNFRVQIVPAPGIAGAAAALGLVTSRRRRR